MADFNDIIWEAIAGICIQHGVMVPTGSRFFLHATDGTDAAGYGLDPDTPVASLEYAVGLCTANAGSLIIAMPGHAETIAAAAVTELDCEGITLICLGNGDNRATFTFSGAVGADINIGADNITIINARFVNSEDGATGPIDVNAAYFSLIGCEFVDNAANTVDWIVLDANADNFLCKDCINKGFDTAGNDSFITVSAAVDRIRVINLVSNGDFAVANIDLSAAACTDLLIEDCKLENKNAVDVNIELLAASTGWISNCRCAIPTDGQTTWINTPGNVSIFECYGTNQGGEAGKFVGTVSV